MNTVRLQDAETQLSALVEAAERGELTTITKHGKPAAMIIPIRQGAIMQEREKPSLIDHLLSMPGDIPLERDQSPVRAVEL